MTVESYLRLRQLEIAQERFRNPSPVEHPEYDPFAVEKVFVNPFLRKVQKRVSNGIKKLDGGSSAC